jgi:cytochrome bd-type quinol oxidase subunit 2
MTVTLIFLGIALVALFWVYWITRKSRSKNS